VAIGSRKSVSIDIGEVEGVDLTDAQLGTDRHERNGKDAHKEKELQRPRPHE
jgi:hypothetical protein